MIFKEKKTPTLLMMPSANGWRAVHKKYKNEYGTVTVSYTHLDVYKRQGAYWSTGGEHGTVPAFPVKRIVDTVGAGDGFAAGVLSAVAEGMSLQEAAARGTVIGSIQITHRGDNEGLPTRAELETITCLLYTSRCV